jgi:tape measure domain-containing protein
MPSDLAIFGLGIEFDESGARRADERLGKLEKTLDRLADATDAMNAHLKKGDGLAKLGDASDQAGRKLANLASVAKSVGAGLSVGLTAPLTAFGVASVRAATQMDSLTRGLTAVSGSSAEAERQLARLREVAKLPGLGFKEAIQGSINLQAAGLSAQTAERALGAFGNALATVGKGKSELDGVILALGQIQSKGKISAEEINQIAERVPQIRKAMIAAFGTADTEIIGKAKVTSEKFINAIITELEKLPKATGGAQNSFENLSDAYEQSMAKMGNASLRILVPALDKAVPLVENLSNKFAGLSPEAQTATVYIAGAAAAMGPLSYAAGGAVQAMTGLAAGVRTVTVAINGGGGLLAVLGTVNPALAVVGGAVVAGGVLWIEYSRRVAEASATIEQAARRARGSVELLNGEKNTVATLGDGTSVNILPGRDMSITLPKGPRVGYGDKLGFSPINPAGTQTNTPSSRSLLSGGTGSKSGVARAKTEAEQLREQLAGVRKEITWLSNPQSQEFILTRQLFLARTRADELLKALKGIRDFPQRVEVEGGLVTGYRPDLNNIPTPASVLAARQPLPTPPAPGLLLSERQAIRNAEFDRDRERIQTRILTGTISEAQARREVLALEREHGAALISILQAKKLNAGADAEALASLDAQIERAKQLGIELGTRQAISVGLRDGLKDSTTINKEFGKDLQNSVRQGIYTGITQGGKAGLSALLDGLAGTFATAATERLTTFLFDKNGLFKTPGINPNEDKKTASGTAVGKAAGALGIGGSDPVGVHVASIDAKNTTIISLLMAIERNTATGTALMQAAEQRAINAAQVQPSWGSILGGIALTFAGNLAGGLAGGLLNRGSGGRAANLAKYYGSNYSVGYGGARAEGGPVMPGTGYLVGERGPELFVPPAPGRIVSNDKLQTTNNKTVNVSVTMHITTKNAESFRNSELQVARRLADAVQAAQRTY